ncbi:MAG: DUF58 domain-containing protein [Planctomycetota bacterium]
MHMLLSRWLKRLVRATQMLGPIFVVLAAAGIPAVLLSGAPSLVLSILTLTVAWQLGSMLLHSTARRVLPEDARLPTYQLTRSGYMYTFATFALALVSIQSGLNSVYLCLALLTALLLSSTIMCGLTTRRLSATREAEGRVFAGQDFPLRVTLHNAKGWLPAAGLAVSLEDAENGAREPQRVPRLRPGQSSDVSFPCRFERRGYHRIPGARLTSRFPLGLTEVSRVYRRWREVLVLPRLGEVDIKTLVRHHERASEWAGSARRKSQTGTFRGLRTYRPGDSLWRIHWRTSARQDELYVKEYEEQTRQRVMLVLDAYVESSGSPEQFRVLDRAVRFTASLANKLEDMDVPFGLLARCPRAISIPPANGRKHLYDIWEALALAEPPQERKPEALMSGLQGRGWMRGGVIMITPDSERSFPSLPKGSITIDVCSEAFHDIFRLHTN